MGGATFENSDVTYFDAPTTIQQRLNLNLKAVEVK